MMGNCGGGEKCESAVSGGVYDAEAEREDGEIGTKKSELLMSSLLLFGAVWAIHNREQVLDVGGRDVVHWCRSCFESDDICRWEGRTITGENGIVRGMPREKGDADGPIG
jgi:hypothetical protein